MFGFIAAAACLFCAVAAAHPYSRRTESMPVKTSRRFIPSFFLKSNIILLIL
jgi:hypothetical protein